MLAQSPDKLIVAEAQSAEPIRRVRDALSSKTRKPADAMRAHSAQRVSALELQSSQSVNNVRYVLLGELGEAPRRLLTCLSNEVLMPEVQHPARIDHNGQLLRLVVSQSSQGGIAEGSQHRTPFVSEERPSIQHVGNSLRAELRSSSWQMISDRRQEVPVFVPHQRQGIDNVRQVSSSELLWGVDDHLAPCLNDGPISVLQLTPSPDDVAEIARLVPFKSFGKVHVGKPTHCILNTALVTRSISKFT
mmetsp:Transcript_31863/g.80757  ORF Transcript_31863/g.80757 Transcript_31863/m.80757 type:complete len:247 (+) Transcript_31863:204-944(+)